jgi:hypothetical protein
VSARRDGGCIPPRCLESGSALARRHLPCICLRSATRRACALQGAGARAEQVPAPFLQHARRRVGPSPSSPSAAAPACGCRRRRLERISVRAAAARSRADGGFALCLCTRRMQAQRRTTALGTTLLPAAARCTLRRCDAAVAAMADARGFLWRAARARGWAARDYRRRRACVRSPQPHSVRWIASAVC